ncbi:MAG: group II intron reverse transcriptase/maturase [Salinibacter sp.]|uniref:group II intron reverse transcriptase/maturase n=1 Tax=Salinibacter sp. TaxID=2065818 RepID=UPI0035D3DFD3
MYENLMETVVDADNAGKALKAVEANKGAPGIDRMRTTELRAHLRKHWPTIRSKLLEGTYVPSPVRRVEIPKPSGGKRPLGIPTVLDRFVQQLLLQALTPIFDPTFSDSSYGFRPGRSAKEAVEAARGFAEEGKDWVVDLDIASFFDEVNHDVLMNRIGQMIRDKRVLGLIGKYLRSGEMSGGVVTAREKGTPQGGPLSPLLANVYLDPLDKELEERGHKFARYADDVNIYVGSERAAERVYQSIKRWIEKHLRLRLNEEKSDRGRTWEQSFLGFRITEDREIEVTPDRLSRLKATVRKMWDGRQNGQSSDLRDRWLRYIRGWWAYFRTATDRESIFRLEGWIRRHIRKCFWQRWHDGRGRLTRLRRLGVTGRRLRVVSTSRGAWRMARHPVMHEALSNKCLRRYGFLLPSDFVALEGQ